MPRQIFYTYSASAPPANPDENSTLYVAPLPYAVGYYKAIAKDEGVFSEVVSNSFGVSPTDYIHYYPFTTDFDDHVGTNNMINYGVTIQNNKAEFDENTDLLTLTNAITSSELTLVLNMTFVDLTGAIFNGVSINYNMLCFNSGKLSFYSTNGYNDSTFTPVANIEYEIVLVKNGSNVKLYVDKVNYLNSDNGIDNSIEQFKNLGNVGTGQQLYSENGYYSEFKIFNRVLSQEEINLL